MNQKEKAINIVKEDRIRFLLEKAGLFWSEKKVRKTSRDSAIIFKGCKNQQDKIKRLKELNQHEIESIIRKTGLNWSDEYITELVTNGESVFRCCETHEDAIQRLQHLAPSISFCFDSLK